MVMNVTVIFGMKRNSLKWLKMEYCGNEILNKQTFFPIKYKKHIKNPPNRNEMGEFYISLYIENIYRTLTCRR